MKEQPKQLAGFIRAVVKGRVARQERESTIAAISKFSELDKTLSTRMYDDLVGTFTKTATSTNEPKRPRHRRPSRRSQRVVNQTPTTSAASGRAIFEQAGWK
jgi:hypothetical protein